MADVHTKAQRSFNMSQVRSMNTKPEVKLRKTLFAKGFRYSLHNKKLPGKTDSFKKIQNNNFCQRMFLART